MVLEQQVDPLAAPPKTNRDATKAHAAELPKAPAPSSFSIPMPWRWAILFACVGTIAFAGFWADQAKDAQVDRIMFWTFIIFSVGLAELFLLFIGLAVLGGVDITTIFQDKPDGTKEGSLSLARLQAFLWTLIVLVTYFHEAVTNKQPGLPTIPSELILVMGISGATYLASKQMSTKGES